MRIGGGCHLFWPLRPLNRIATLQLDFLPYYKVNRSLSSLRFINLTESQEVIKIVIGMDVHKRSVYITVLDDKGEIVEQENMENNISIIDCFLEHYKDHDIVIESSTSGKYLSKELLKLEYKIHLINPEIVSAIETFKKTDREDSYKLAYLYRVNALKEIYIPSEEIENIRSLVRYRYSLGQEITLKKNKIHALLTSYGIIIKATDPFGVKGLREIENSYKKFNSDDKTVLRSLLSDISNIKEREDDLNTVLSSELNFL